VRVPCASLVTIGTFQGSVRVRIVPSGRVGALGWGRLPALWSLLVTIGTFRDPSGVRIVTSGRVGWVAGVVRLGSAVSGVGFRGRGPSSGCGRGGLVHR